MVAEALRKQRAKNAQKRVVGRPFEKGNPGRPKGTPNKTTRLVRENISEVFEKLGGVDGMFKWANKSDFNRAQFYQIYAKLLPLDVQSGGEPLAAAALFLMPRPGQKYDEETFDDAESEKK